MSKTRSRRRQAPQAASSPQDAAAGSARLAVRQVIRALQAHGIRPGARVLDLCCGYGRQAVGLARAGYRVVGVDIRSDPGILKQWQAQMAERPQLQLISADVRRLPLRGRFDAAVLLSNGLSLFSSNDDAISLLREMRRLMAPKGLLLLDNVCQAIWEEIAAGRYASGISEDGLWQMAWLSGRNVFALRYGDQVRPGHPQSQAGETVYRAWSLDELDLLCRLTGWRLQAPRRRQALLAAFPAKVD